MVALLASLSMEVVEASDAWDAMRLVARAAESARLFDLVIADAALPGMGGADLARRLAQTAHAQRPVLLIGNGMTPPAPGLRMLGRPLSAAALEAACLAALGGTAVPPADDPLAMLPGVDAATGRATTRGNDQLYRRLLVLFLKTQRDFASRFAEAQAGTDRAAATRYAHDLKATAGSLGMVPLQQVAAELEEACTAGVPPVALVERVQAALKPVIAGLERLAP
ncbi:MAG: Hpt domain-containing protein [Proteobacteria bacterium]|nr:Hpt domain-containing protein [Pseudomonadota bacterium]